MPNTNTQLQNSFPVLNLIKIIIHPLLSRCMPPNKLCFGPAGVPRTTPSPGGTLKGIARVKELGLDSMELEFVHGVRMKPAMAKQVNQARLEHDVGLTAHGPYYINLNSLEEDKIKASVERILATGRIAHLCGAESFTFHAAFYMKKDPGMVFKQVLTQLQSIRDTLDSESNPITIRPELTGKATQWGSLEELLNLSCEIEGVLPCIDFAHLHARNGGKYNTSEEFEDVLAQMEAALGRAALDNLHIHLAGIEYSDKGERKHLDLQDSDMNYIELMQALKDFDVKGYLVCESPNQEDDALLLKQTYNGL